MTWTRTLLLSSAAMVLFFAGASAQAQATGYWQYVRTETYYWSCSGHPGLIGYGGCGAYPDTGTGSEGAYTVIVNNTQSPTPQFGGTFYWSHPPTILVPGTAPDWPIAAKLVADDHLHESYHQWLDAALYPYAATSNLDTFMPWATNYLGVVDLWGGRASTILPGTVVTYNNIQQSQPVKICELSTICGDAQGRLSWLVWINSTSTWYWNYVYQWVPGATPGKCGGTCGVAAPGQTMGVNGGNGSIAVTATSTWDVIAVSNWITITSPTSGSGNGTVSFTVSANTGPPRTGAILIGGQTYAVHQDGLAVGTTAGCSYQIQSNTTQNIPAGGGSGQVQIVTGQNCAWTASTTVSWISISSGRTGTGNGTVSYTAAANDSTLPRSAPIVIAGQNVAINQAGITGLPIYLRFENGTAGTTAAGAGSIADSSGSGQAGTPSGTLTYRSDAPVSPLPGTSTANNLSLEFGSNGIIQFSSAFPLNVLTNATMEFWIKPTGSAATMEFLWTRTDATDANRFNMGVLTSGGNRSIFFDYREPSGVLHPLYGMGFGGLPSLAPPIPISATGWTHVAVVKSGNTWTSYANGVQQGTPVNDANAVLPTNTGWTLNGRGVAPYIGFLDEFRISNSALSPSQFLLKVPPYEPKLTKNLAPGFYILEATLASGAQSGFWGLEVLTSLGQAAGGFNLGGALYASSASPDFGTQPAFGAFALSTTQTVTATMNAQLPAGATLKMRFLDSNRNQLGNAATGTSPLVLSQTLAPGFYICEAYSSASTFATYQLGLAASFFSGGVDTGGFLAPGVVGFGAFYVPVQQDVTMKLYGQNTYGAAGAGSMVLTLKDADRKVIATNP